MKKILLACSLFLLTGCDYFDSTPPAGRTEGIDTESQFNTTQITNTINDYFNIDEELVSINLENEITTTNSPDPHNEYQIEAIDGRFKNEIINHNNAMIANSPTDENLAYIASIQQKVKQIASRLDNDSDIVSFSYTDDNGQAVVIAESSRAQDYISLIEVETEISANDLDNSDSISDEVKLDDNVARTGMAILVPDSNKLIYLQKTAEEVRADGYTEEEAAYWNSLASQYGFPAYDGVSNFSQYVVSAQQWLYNAQTYGDPYYEEPVYEEPVYEEPSYEEPSYEEPVTEEPITDIEDGTSNDPTVDESGSSFISTPVPGNDN